MKKEPTYKELQEKIIRLEERIAYLERMLYGSKSDRMPSSPQVDVNQPGLFDDQFNEVLNEKAAKIAETVKEIENEARKRKERRKKEKSRPARYHYHGLEERTTVVVPDGIDPSEYDVIGKDVMRVLHRESAKVWVEVIERPILRKKTDRNETNAELCQAPSPKSAIGGGHVGSDMLSQIVIDKYRYHQPEYRQIKQYADLGLRLPASTLNDWVYAVALRLEPIYEALRDKIRRSDYLQIDEVPWRIADRPGKCRHGYAGSFMTLAQRALAHTSCI